MGFIPYLESVQIQHYPTYILEYGTVMVQVAKPYLQRMKQNKQTNKISCMSEKCISSDYWFYCYYIIKYLTAQFYFLHRVQKIYSYSKEHTHAHRHTQILGSRWPIENTFPSVM